MAVAAILTSVFALSLGDALIKEQSVSFVLWQIFIMRSVIAIPFLIFFVRLQSCRTSLLPVNIKWTAARSLLLVVMWVFYFAALPYVALATAAAAFYTLPLFIALGAALFLGEPIRSGGIFAICLGFVGTIMILQPQADDFNVHALLPVVAAICYAAAMLLTRSKCQTEDPILLSLWLNASFIVVGTGALLVLQIWSPDEELIAHHPFLLGTWTPMHLGEWRVIGVLAVMIVMGSIFAAIAYQRGPPSTIATFDFAYVGLATIWGFLLFDEIPDPYAVLGILLIVVAGITATRQSSHQSGSP